MAFENIHMYIYIYMNIIVPDSKRREICEN